MMGIYNKSAIVAILYIQISQFSKGNPSENDQKKMSCSSDNYWQM